MIGESDHLWLESPYFGLVLNYLSIRDRIRIGWVCKRARQQAKKDQANRKYPPVDHKWVGISKSQLVWVGEYIRPEQLFLPPTKYMNIPVSDYLGRCYPVTYRGKTYPGLGVSGLPAQSDLTRYWWPVLRDKYSDWESWLKPFLQYTNLGDVQGFQELCTWSFWNPGAFMNLLSPYLIDSPILDTFYPLIDRCGLDRHNLMRIGELFERVNPQFRGYFDTAGFFIGCRPSKPTAARPSGGRQGTCEG